MALTETGGSTALTAGGGETTFYDSGAVAVNNWAFTVFLDNLVSGDTLTINVYKLDVTGNALKLIYTFNYPGPFSTSIEVPYISSTHYKVTGTLTGASKTINWNRYNM